jgi:hypothetical protein
MGDVTGIFSFLFKIKDHQLPLKYPTLKQKMPELSEEDIQSLYMWIDEIPLSRPKKNMTRDFGDGCMAAEVIRHFLPKLVELHNYSAANSVSQKFYNWKTLNRKICLRG